MRLLEIPLIAGYGAVCFVALRNDSSRYLCDDAVTATVHGHGLDTFMMIWPRSRYMVTVTVFL